MKSKKKRLIAAALSLLLSTFMLGSSTYAWFTMSREVEVTGIQLVAAMPENIQISLGEITDASESNSLANNSGYLSGNAPSSIYDWSNSADIGHYYSFGRLIPASSTDGENIYFTPDADGIGRTIKADGSFYAAAVADTATDESDIGSGTGTLQTTAHLNTATEWSGTSSTAWNITNDDGYYVDIPVWLRTSATVDQNIYVCGYVTDNTEENNEDTDDLYQAVRVAILTEDCGANGGCLTLADGGDTLITAGTTTHAAAFPTSIDDGILDSDNYNGRTENATGISAIAADTPTWSTITKNDGSAVVATLAAGDGKSYGDETKLIIRVWLEGEDGNCWNANAGQDWNIALKFMLDPLS